MKNLFKRNKENKTDKGQEKYQRLEEEKNIGNEEVMLNQGSEEQRMKEKYISEVSKIEDAPGDGGEEKVDQ